MATQWTIQRGDREHGPMSSTQLRKLANSGKLRPTDLVRNGESNRWKSAASVPGLFADKENEESDESNQAATHEVSHLLDYLIPIAHDLLPEEMFRSINRGIVALGRYAQWIAFLSFVAYQITTSLKSDSVRLLLIGGLLSVALLVLQYWSQRTSSAIEISIASTPVRLTSTAIVDGLAVTCLLSAVCLPAIVLLQGLQQEEPIITVLMRTCMVFLSFTYVASLALYPQFVNLHIDASASAGEEAVGVVSLILRLAFRLVPIAYSLGMVLVSFALLAAVISLLQGKENVIEGLLLGESVVPITMWFAALPLMSYLLFIFYSLFIDLVRSVMAIPVELKHLGSSLHSDHPHSFTESVDQSFQHNAATPRGWPQ